MLLENVRLLNGSKRIKVIAKEHGIDEVLVSKKAGMVGLKNPSSSMIRKALDSIMLNVSRHFHRRTFRRCLKRSASGFSKSLEIISYIRW